MQTLGIEDVMPFGKYKGIKIKRLIEEWHFLNTPCNYLNWAIVNWKNIKFSKEIKIAIEKNQKEIRDIQNEDFGIIKKHNYKEDYGAFSCPGDYMGMNPSDFGIPYC